MGEKVHFWALYIQRDTPAIFLCVLDFFLSLPFFFSFLSFLWVNQLLGGIA